MTVWNMKLLSGFMKFWTLFIGTGALIGALMMWTDPSGKMWLMDPLLDDLRAKLPLPGIFFRDFVPSGFVLLAVNGITQYIAAWMLFRKHPLAAPATLICGVILMLWIALEWYIFGFYAICNVYFAFGLLEALTALRAIIRNKSQCL